MKTRLVKPPDIPDSEIEKLEKAIIKLLWEELYKPLVAVVPALDKKTISNSKNDLLRAIKSGRVVFHRGTFKGTFSASLSGAFKALGAKWDRKQGSWKVLLASLPQDVQQAIRLSENAFNNTFRSFNAVLAKVTPETIASKVDMTDLFDTMLFKLDGQISKQIKGITVNVDLTKAEKLKIAEEYNTNMQLYIKDFSEKQIKTLRARVQKNYYSGNRYENLVEDIQNNFRVSKNKAKFLAKQETNLIQAKYKEVRYRSSGSPGYYWRTVKGTPKHPVRPGHAVLDGTYHRWDNPPVVDPKTGRRAHPKQDFNCVLPDTDIQFTSALVRSYRRKYAGLIHKISLKSGTTLNLTPNHPVLTKRGWVFAHEVNASDQLFEGFGVNMLNGRAADVNKLNAKANEVFDLAAVVGFSKRISASNNEFHGDVGLNEEVDVVSENSFLRDEFNIVREKEISNDRFAVANDTSGGFSGLGHLFKLISRFDSTASSLMRTPGLVDSLGRSHSTPLEFFRFTLTADMYAFFNQNSSDSTPTYAKDFRNCILALSLNDIEINNLWNVELYFIMGHSTFYRLGDIIDVAQFDYSGEVYNFETLNNTYMASNIIVSNCRCDARIVLVEPENEE